MCTPWRDNVCAATPLPREKTGLAIKRHVGVRENPK